MGHDEQTFGMYSEWEQEGELDYENVFRGCENPYLSSTVHLTCSWSYPEILCVTRLLQWWQVDGCAIFWRRVKFRLAENYTVEFNECARRAVSAMPGLPPDDGHHFLMRVSKDNIAQAS